MIANAPENMEIELSLAPSLAISVDQKGSKLNIIIQEMNDIILIKYDSFPQAESKCLVQKQI